MALNFTNQSRSYDGTRHAVRFWGYDQSREISFFITADALRRFQPDVDDNEDALLAAFEAHRPRIHVVAGKVYAKGPKGSYELGPQDL